MTDNITDSPAGINMSVIQFEGNFFVQIEDEVYEAVLVSPKNIFTLKKDGKPEKFMDFLKDRVGL